MVGNIYKVYYIDVYLEYHFLGFAMAKGEEQAEQEAAEAYGKSQAQIRAIDATQDILEVISPRREVRIKKKREE